MQSLKLKFLWNLKKKFDSPGGAYSRGVVLNLKELWKFEGKIEKNLFDESEAWSGSNEQKK